jgi:hypothetical protein
MTGFRIGVDVRGLVHQNWRRLPWRYRLLALIPGERARIEAAAARGLAAKGGDR